MMSYNAMNIQHNRLVHINKKFKTSEINIQDRKKTQFNNLNITQE